MNPNLLVSLVLEHNQPWTTIIKHNNVKSAMNKNIHSKGHYVTWYPLFCLNAWKWKHDKKIKLSYGEFIGAMPAIENGIYTDWGGVHASFAISFHKLLN